MPRHGSPAGTDRRVPVFSNNTRDIFRHLQQRAPHAALHRVGERRQAGHWQALLQLRPQLLHAAACTTLPVSSRRMPRQSQAHHGPTAHTHLQGPPMLPHPPLCSQARPWRRLCKRARAHTAAPSAAPGAAPGALTGVFHHLNVVVSVSEKARPLPVSPAPACSSFPLALSRP